MAGGSQGIVVSIQAKIEGWQNQIKEIQNAMKNLNVGSSLSKDLAKDLKQVESMVTNLGKNMNQRLTSDSQINHFTDRLNTVDEIFGQIGQKMQGVSFQDLDVDYVTQNFQELISAIETAEQELSQGMQQSFQAAIAGSSNLQKAFDKLGIDPSKMGIEELRQVLSTKSSELTTEIGKANKEIDSMTQRIRELKQQSKDIENMKIMKISDVNTEAKNIIGDTSQLGVSKGLNTQFLQDLSNHVQQVMDNAGTGLQQKIAGKKEEINQALQDLVNSNSIEQARQRIEALGDIFASIKAKGDFGFSAADMRGYYTQLETLIPDETVIRQKMDAVREALRTDGVSEKDLNNIIPNIEKLLRQGKFDELPTKVAEILRQTQQQFKTEGAKISEEANRLTVERGNKQKEVMSTAATKYNVDQGLTKYDAMIAEIRAQNEQLRQEVEQLKQQLADKATGNVKGTGTQISMSSQQALAQSTAVAKSYENQLHQVQAAEQMLGKIQGVIQRWFSVYAVVRMVGNAIRSVISTIKELDKTITNIAIVTDMGQSDLWKQMPKYTQMARDYASSISGVYEVSQLYYQQGLEMSDVMSLTEATLKMARISGLGYSDATDYMTNAVRSFKMEMTDATRVVDVYSSVAASSATSVTELATAMSKTASSAQAVGASFENTTAMMAVMIEATRESPENIGSAMKSIISRYGELKENKTGIDTEGEEYSLNKVDTALQSVGITIHDVKGEFRDFDDVIMELADKWNTIDKNTQRYIATVMAGNRQQSRFLALVSSGDRLKELSEEATNSEDASQLQLLKSLDGVEAKVQQLQTSIQALYTNSGLEQVYAGLLNFANSVITTLDNISNHTGLVGVVAKIGSTFTALATLVTTLFTTIKLKFSQMQAQIIAEQQYGAAQREASQAREAYKAAETYEEQQIAYAKMQAAMNKEAETGANYRAAKGAKALTGWKGAGMAASAAGLALTTWGASMDVETQRNEKAITTGLGGVLSGVGTGFMMGGWVGAVMGTLTALPSVLESIGMITESTTEKIERLKSNITKAENKAIISKNELNTLTEYGDKLKELSLKQYQSAEDKQAYLDLSNEIANKYPELISYIDSEGNKIVELGQAYADLKQKKAEAYQDDARNASIERIRAASDAHYRLSEAGITAPERKKQWYNETFDFLGGVANGLSVAASGNPLLIKNRIFDSSGEGTIFSQEGSSFDYVADNLANYGFAGSMRWAHSGGYGTGSTKDTMKAVFGVNKEIKLNESNLQSALSAAGINLTDENISSILSMKNTPQAYGRLVDILMAAGKGKKDIDTVIKALLGQEAELNNDLWTYRTQVMSSEKATRGAEKLIKQENKSLFSTTISQDKYDVSEGLETQFLQYSFQKKWEQESAGLTDDQIAAAWEDFSYRAEDNIDTAIKSYTDVIAGITDPETLVLMENMFKNPQQYSKTQWLALQKQFEQSGNTDLADFLLTYYSDQIEYASSNFLNGMTNLQTKYRPEVKLRYKDMADQISGEFLPSMLNQYESIFSNKGLNNGQRQNAVTQMENAYLSANSIEDQEKRTQALSILSSADMSTQTGLFSAISQIKKLNLGTTGDQIIGSLQEMTGYVKTNLVTEFSNLSSSVISSIQDFDKAISNASKGMDLKTAMAMAEKMGKTLADFSYINGKYFYDNFSDIESAYLPDNEEAISSLREKKDKTIAESKTTLTASNAFILEKAKQIRANAPIDHYMDEQESIELAMQQTTGTLDQFIQSNYDQGLDAIMAAIEDAGIADNMESMDSTTLRGYVSLYLNRSAEDINLSFSDWLEKYLNQMYQANVTEIENYTRDQTARAYLSNGNITGFVHTLDDEYFRKRADEIRKASIKGGSYQISEQDALEQARNEVADIIASGDLDNLPENLQKYAGLIYDTYHSVHSSIANAMIASINGNGSNIIKVTEANAKELARLQEKGWIKEGAITVDGYVTIAAEKLNSSAGEFLQYVVESFETEAEQIKALGDYHKNKYSKSKTASLNNIIGKETFEYTDLLSYMTNIKGFSLNDLVANDEALLSEKMEEMGLAYNAAGEVYVKNYELWIESLESDVEAIKEDPNASRAEINAAQARLDTAKNTQQKQRNKAVKDVISNYTDVSEEQLEALANSLDEEDYNTIVDKYIVSDENGQRRLNLAQLKQDIDNGKITVSEATEQALRDQINSFYDDAVKYISTGTQLMTQGTTSQEEMSKFSDKMSDLISEGYLETDAIPNQEDYFSFDDTTKTFKLTDEAWKAYLEGEKARLADLGYNQTEIASILTREAAAQVDITGYLKSDRSKLSQSNLETQIKNWLRTKYYGVDLGGRRIIKKKSQIEAGGQAAVDVMNELAEDYGKELSTDEIEAAYRAQVAPLSSLAESIATLEAGSIVAKNQIDALRTAGFQVNTDGVVTVVGDLVSAYRSIYQQMKNTGEATISELNKVVGNLLDNRDGEQIAINAIEKAMGMRYSDLAQIYTDAGIQLTESMINQMLKEGTLKHLGGNQVMISDFEAFAKQMGWDPTSEQYFTELKAYRESRAKYNKTVETGLKEELTALQSAKVGDEINVDWILSQYGDIFKTLGYEVEQGMLKITEGMQMDEISLAVAKRMVQAGHMVKSELDDLMASMQDTILSGIKTAAGYVTKGTDSFDSMQQFAEEMNKLIPGETTNAADYFEYDTVLNTFKLSSTSFEAYKNAQKARLKELGWSDELINEYIQDQIDNAYKQNLDLKDILSTGLITKNKAVPKLASQLQTLGYKFSTAFDKTADAATETIEDIITILEKGGPDAVRKWIEIKGAENVTEEELAQLYNAPMQRLREAQANLAEGVGATFGGIAAEIIRADQSWKGKYEEIGNGEIVITAVGDMVSTYIELYARMKAEATKTNKDLNDLYVQLLTANDQNNIDIKEALSSASSMTYDAFGKLMTSYGLEMREVLNDPETFGSIISDGFGNLNITNFKKFVSGMAAKSSNWSIDNINNPQFAKLYNDYIDAEIELANLPTTLMQSAVDQLTALTDLKPGKVVNVSYLKLDELMGERLQKWLLSYGATYVNGMLSISNSTNVAALITDIANELQKAGKLTNEQRAEIQDALNELLEGIVSLIKNAISGTLSNVDANKLNTWYQDMQIQNGVSADLVKSLQFEQTSEGLKVTNASLRECYFYVKEIDAIQGEIVFDELKDSLIETEDHFRTIQDTLVYIAELNEKIANAPAGSARLESLQKELELAKKINMERSTKQDDSFNFMSGKIPEAQNNPLNYWKNLGQAFDVMKASMKGNKQSKNTMAYENFYNIVSEMGRIAELTQDGIDFCGKTLHNSQEAADLITSAAENLKNLNGELVVNLNGVGLNINTSNLKNMANQVDKAVDQVAQSQIAMLDSLISLLEVIVAMEALEDVDANQDLEIEIPEIAIEDSSLHSYVDAEGYLHQFNAAWDGVLAQLRATIDKSEEGKSAFDKVKVNTSKGSYTMSQIIKADTQQLKEMGIDAKTYTKLMSNLYKMVKNQDYDDLTDTAGSIFDIFQRYDWGDMSISVDTGEYTFTLNDSGNYTIVWEQVDYDALRAALNTTERDEDLQTKIQTALDKARSGQPLTVTENLTLKIAQGTIKIEYDESGENVTGYKVGNKTYNTPEEAAAASDILGAGGTLEGDIEVETHKVTAKGKIVIGNVEISVESQGEGLVYQIPGDPNSDGYTSQSAMLEAWFRKENDWDENKEVNVESAEYKTWEVKKGLNIKPVFTVERGKEGPRVGDPTKDPELKQQIKDFLNQPITIGKDKVGENSISIELPAGAKVELPTNGLKFENDAQVAAYVEQELSRSIGLDDALASTITKGITDAFRALPEALQSLEGIKTDKIKEIAGAIEEIGNKALTTTGLVQALGEVLANIFNLFGMNVKFPSIPEPKTPSKESEGSAEGAGTEGTSETVDVIGKVTSLDISGLANAVIDVIGKITSVETSELGENAEIITNQTIIPSGQIEKIDDFITNQTIESSGGVYDIPDFDTIQNIQVRGGVTDIPDFETTQTIKTVGGTGEAAGNFGLAKAGGTPTLMGELGPELVVSNGRYFVAGQNGAEMVNLNKDAIVFNHLQTKQLLDKGMSPGRGKAVTNERNAVAFATGNVTGGPAMASAQSALNALKQLKAMWESLRKASVSDLAGAGGGGGGGGGGQNKIVDPKAWVDTVERWYNLTQKIAELEQEITYQQKIREKIQSDFQKDGAAYYRSQKLSLDAINDQIKAQEELNVSRKDYFQKRIENLKKESLGRIYTFDEDGQLQFRKDTTINGKKGGMEFLTDLYGFNNLGKANYTNKEKYEILKNSGFIDYMKYDSNGMEIKVEGEGSESDWETFYEKATQAFRDRMDQYAEATQSLRDEIKKGEETLEEYEKNRNELLKEMRDNQIAVEEKVLTAIEQARQREIDALQNERDALEESVGKYIDGLSDALDKEQKMYEDQDAQDELNRNKRRLAILQRSGGSVTDINKLQSEIRDQERELYFDA